LKVCVLGLWHLGTVTAACLAAGGHEVTGLDFDPAVVSRLAAGNPPLFEPGLEDLVHAGLASGLLRFTTDVAEAVRTADIVWVACDTPVDDDDRADVAQVIAQCRQVFPDVRDGTLILISSQVPVGTTRRLEQMFASESRGRTVGFGYSPENLRLGKAIEVFTHPERVVAGVRAEVDREKVIALLRPFTGRIEWMSIESAEMTKHALNAFLATSVTFINEIAALCEQVGADATEVERGLKSEARIGPKAYLSPGGAFAGGTLARDVVFLSQLGQAHGVATHLLSSVKPSNDAHRHWGQQRLSQLLGGVAGTTIGVWGLTYKPGTDTLRRSSAVDLCLWLHAQGARVRAHDPAVRTLPPGLAAQLELTGSAAAAADGASALVVATPWPEYRTIAPADIAARMVRRLVLDASRFLGETLGRHEAFEYVSVGVHRPAGGGANNAARSVSE
jgi:UDPglucose 6-dehydrogenase